MDASRVRIDPVVAVHERLEAHQVIAHRERHRSQFDQVMRRLPGGLAVEGHETQVVDRCGGFGPRVRHVVLRVIEGSEGFLTGRAKPG